MAIFKRGKHSVSPAAQIADERKNILTAKSDFYVREAYKTLRTNVMFALADQDGCKTFIVTSSLQSEGKSITALNLAISFAMAESRVILIDCDLRRPKLARLLGENAQLGLSNLLLKPELLRQAIVKTDVENLDVITSGDIPPNPSELLGSARMEALLDHLRADYDYIILDTPPVNMVTDAVVLAPKSDGVLFVVRANQSERGLVMRAVEQLQYAQAKMLGFVLDDVPATQGSYGYGKYKKYGHYGYGKGYGYGYGYGEQPKAPAKADSSQT